MKNTKTKCDVCGEKNEVNLVAGVKVCHQCLLDCKQPTTPSHPPEPEMTVEQVKPVDVMTADIVIGKDVSTGRHHQIHPSSMLEVIRRGGLDGTLTTLCFSFDGRSKRHEEMIDEIIMIAKGEASIIVDECHHDNDGTNIPINASPEVHLQRHLYYCFLCRRGGNQLDLWAAAKNLPLHAATLDLCQHLGIQPITLIDPQPPNLV